MRDPAARAIDRNVGTVAEVARIVLEKERRGPASRRLQCRAIRIEPANLSLCEPRPAHPDVVAQNHQLITERWLIWRPARQARPIRVAGNSETNPVRRNDFFEFEVLR